MHHRIEPEHCRVRRVALAFVCIGGAVWVAGCRPAAGEVSGTIKINGQVTAVKGMEISLLACDGRLFGAPIGADGKYSATGVPAGEVRVAFVYVPGTIHAKPGRAPLARPGNDVHSRSSDDPEAMNPIPKQLRDANTSKLSLIVNCARKTVFDYDIRYATRP
jgi:hypothetical protein